MLKLLRIYFFLFDGSVVTQLKITFNNSIYILVLQANTAAALLNESAFTFADLRRHVDVNCLLMQVIKCNILLFLIHLLLNVMLKVSTKYKKRWNVYITQPNIFLMCIYFLLVFLQPQKRVLEYLEISQSYITFYQDNMPLSRTHIQHSTFVDARENSQF